MKQELIFCRTNLVCLIDKAWELGGCYLGEDEFEEIPDIKDAREQIKRIDKILNT